MKITKYEHACLVLEDGGKKLVIDPGKFSVSLPHDKYDVVVITHIHSDHMDTDKIKAFQATNPALEVFTTQQAGDELKSAGINVEVVKAGQVIDSEGFNLKFYGGNHELYKDFQNVAVLINDTLLHPGDSYTKPDAVVKVLAAPASAPWLRITEAADYITSVKAKLVFPIHNSLLSEIGESVHYPRLEAAAQSVGGKWQVLKPGESTEI